VSDLTIRPTAKFIMVRALFAVAVFLVLEIAWYTQWRETERLTFVPILAPLVLISPAWRALGRQFTKTTISGDRLRYETGAFSKSTRTIQLSKLQDVRVDQSFSQRMFGVGNLSLETSGETSRLVLDDVDNPQSTADEIMNRCQFHGTPTA
jgi:uncharacterized membrane protein YdbT with pleckstrin-like domain